ncbi:ParA family protein [Acidobacteria bacterium ACD]|nr:MAG: ParA family protein [Acidobacteriota bacterium]MCE7956982.1 ParA family protein [Acidobacteria bacterium ACB2]MDL1948458.1 ParA family protein [Acidobacteria bacterium ACD]
MVAGGRARVLSVWALKGGVGKTTTAVNLAAAAARAGRNVLLVDADPQGSVSAALGVLPEAGLDAWLSGAKGFEEVVLAAARPGLDVVGSGDHLLRVEEALREKGPEKRRGRLAKRLGQVPEGRYDVVILDTPPAATLLLENALEASGEVLLPAKLDPLSVPALERSRRYLAELPARPDRPRKVLGVLPTFHDLRTRVPEEVLEDLRRRFRKVLSPIRVNSDLAVAPSLGQTIFDWDPWCRGAVDYALLAEELGLA